MTMKIILAPSGAGKTHAVLSAVSGKLGACLVDGDVIIHETIGWPPGRWWEDATSKARVHRNNWAALKDWAETWMAPEGIIVFNGHVPDMHDVLACVVMPSVADHLEHMRLRRERHLAIGRVSVQPKTTDEMRRNRDAMFDVAKRFSLRVYDTFEAGIAHFKQF